MKTVTIYESRDGIKFTCKKHCRAYERILNKCDAIRGLIPLPRHIEWSHSYIQHKKSNVALARKLYIELVSQVVPYYMQWIQKNGQSIDYLKITDKVLQQEGFECFVDIANRLARIDSKGREFQFPELTLHPNGVNNFHMVKV